MSKVPLYYTPVTHLKGITAAFTLKGSGHCPLPAESGKPSMVNVTGEQSSIAGGIQGVLGSGAEKGKFPRLEVIPKAKAEDPKKRFRLHFLSTDGKSKERVPMAQDIRLAFLADETTPATLIGELVSLFPAADFFKAVECTKTGDFWECTKTGIYEDGGNSKHTPITEELLSKLLDDESAPAADSDGGGSDDSVVVVDDDDDADDAMSDGSVMSENSLRETLQELEAMLAEALSAKEYAEAAEVQELIDNQTSLIAMREFEREERERAEQEQAERERAERDRAERSAKADLLNKAKARSSAKKNQSKTFFAAKNSDKDSNSASAKNSNSAAAKNSGSTKNSAAKNSAASSSAASSSAAKSSSAPAKNSGLAKNSSAAKSSSAPAKNSSAAKNAGSSAAAKNSSAAKKKLLEKAQKRTAVKKN